MNDSLTDPAASRATTERLDYPKLFFPGTINAAEATGVTVGLGEERQGIDIRLQLVPMAKLSGTFAGLEAKAQELGLATPTIASFGIVNEDVDPAQPFAGNAGFLDGDPGYWVPSRRRIQATRPITDGAFRVTGLAPGDYFIAVATDIDPSQLYEPALLQELKRGAIPLHLVDGDRKEQVLRIGGMD